MVDITSEKLHEQLVNLFVTSLNDNVFSGASLGYLLLKDEGSEQSVSHYGKTDCMDTSLPVDGVTFFDLASLTKPLVTVLSVLALLDEGKVRLEENLESLIGFEVPSDKRNITLRQLISHSSGLPAHRPYYEKLLDYPLKERKEKITQWIIQENLLYKPGSNNIYSDLDYILLGCIIERKSARNLEKYWRQKILAPLNLEEYFYFSGKQISSHRKFAATGMCPWSNKLLCGTVHDDNCRAMGGVAGHAGLFGTVEGVLLLCEKLIMCSRDASSLSFSGNGLLNNLLNKKRNNRWIMGFDTPSKPYSSSGTYFSEKSVGHLGFTGTSFWIDLEEGIIIVFLSNRVLLLNGKQKIQEFRPKLHDTIMEELLKK